MAAIAVVLYHAGVMASLPQYYGYIPFRGAFNFGHAGVDFFFVLSGFIIYYVHHADIGQPAKVGRYIWRRVVRIYPIYWIVTAIMLGILFRRHGGFQNIDLKYFLNSIILLPAARHPIVDVAWTLQHEILFYAVFCVAILSRYLGFLLIAAWTGLVILGLFMAPSDELIRWFASPFHLQFFMGSVAAHMLLKREIPRPLVIAVLGGIAIIAIGTIETLGIIGRAGALNQILFGASASCLVLGLAAAERRGKIRLNWIGEYLGGASYTLYLIHTIIIGGILKTFNITNIIPIIPGFMLVLIGTSVAILGAAIVYSRIESPITIALNNFGRTRLFALQINSH